MQALALHRGGEWHSTCAQERLWGGVRPAQGLEEQHRCMGKAAGPAGKAIREAECKGVMEKS